MTNIAKAAADAADARQQALELIKARAARGDSPRYIARALELADIPTSKGREKMGTYVRRIRREGERNPAKRVQAGSLRPTVSTVMTVTPRQGPCVTQALLCYS